MAAQFSRTSSPVIPPISASRRALGTKPLPTSLSDDPDEVETNIVRFRLRGVPAGRFVEEAHRLGVYMLPSGPNAVRAVFYLNIIDSDVERASELVGEALRHQGRQPEEIRSGSRAQS